MFTETTNTSASTEKCAFPTPSITHLCWLARGAIAAVWAYNGVYCKLLLGDTTHLKVLESLPFITPHYARLPLAWIGLLETCLAAWVLIGLAPRRAAWVQTLLLLSMNLGGLLWARESIAQPGAMIVQNISFLTLIWIAATLVEDTRHDRAHA